MIDRGAAYARLAALGAVLLVAGCAAGQTAIAKRNLDVQTRMTDTVFLDPVPPHQRTVYIEVRNTSDKPDLDVAAAVRSAVAARGYRIVEDPQAAQFWLQANVLQAGRNAETAIEKAYSGGFGGTLVGGAVGGGVGYAIGRAGGGNDILLAAGGALLGAAIEGAAGAYVQDVSYSIVTDLQISERAPGGVVVSQSETGQLGQGRSTTVSQASSTVTDRKRYQTRIVSSANKVNLAWEEAAPELVAGLSRSIAGIL
jgi:hypothetical protein